MKLRWVDALRWPYTRFVKLVKRIKSKMIRCLWILFTNPSALAGYDTRSIFKRGLACLNSEFSFSKTSCLTKAEEPSLSYYLPIAGGRIIGFIPSPKVLVLCEMQSVSSRIWTRVAVFISYDDNDYTTGTFGWLYKRLMNAEKRRKDQIIWSLTKWSAGIFPFS